MRAIRTEGHRDEIKATQAAEGSRHRDQCPRLGKGGVSSRAGKEIVWRNSNTSGCCSGARDKWRHPALVTFGPKLWGVTMNKFTDTSS